MRTVRVRYVCTDCKRKMTGAPGDDTRRSCETCGGQLKAIRYGPARQRRR